jgi:predicted methyltransferase
MRRLALFALAPVLAVPALIAAAPPVRQDDPIARAVAASARTPANLARDRYRHPAETLAFFGVKPSDTVVEIWPGGGWYTEILAPLVKGDGTLWVAAPGPAQLKGVEALLARDSQTFGAIRTAAFPHAGTAAKVPDGSADVVLTFRNVHNWRMAGDAQAAEAFRQMFAMLKPGGTLGIEDHRLPEAADPARERSSGYLKVSTVRRLAEAAGFEFVAASEVNANPRDSADWPQGVWTLPPTLRLGEQDRARYLAIGESDRMTLKFRKPGRHP